MLSSTKRPRGVHYSAAAFRYYCESNTIVSINLPSMKQWVHGIVPSRINEDSSEIFHNEKQLIYVFGSFGKAQPWSIRPQSLCSGNNVKLLLASSVEKEEMI